MNLALELYLDSPHPFTIYPCCFVIAALFVAEKANDNRGGVVWKK